MLLPHIPSASTQQAASTRRNVLISHSHPYSPSHSSWRCNSLIRVAGEEENTEAIFRIFMGRIQEKNFGFLFPQGLIIKSDRKYRFKDAPLTSLTMEMVHLVGIGIILDYLANAFTTQVETRASAALSMGVGLGPVDQSSVIYRYTSQRTLSRVLPYRQIDALWSEKPFLGSEEH
ncbi:hypothetical protein PILCRDRAFT_13106 [Piloderma croceum F 1598]|uniref:Uncharacterized protein n=1 Tax=Piloderma croceum (strain F 1598) TaxID=765440 RepID=A0A0C3F8F7_PILCF|nr:hypothetical protein PILCRDRAFT_13106 [Piloderma croceum F 1598]